MTQIHLVHVSKIREITQPIHFEEPCRIVHPVEEGRKYSPTPDAHPESELKVPVVKENPIWMVGWVALGCLFSLGLLEGVAILNRW